jgi:L-alanine-DL-glutamate epimerase-like enolase superfamily enzyme
MRHCLVHHRLALRRRFTIARGSSDFRINLLFAFEREGWTGFGLAAPYPRYGESPESCRLAVEAMLPLLEGGDLLAWNPLAQALRRALSGQFAAKACVEMALLDWVGKRLGLPLYRLFGVDPGAMKPTSMTIGMDDLELVRVKVREASAYAVLKIKLGGPADREMIQAIREVSDQPLRVDANEGWANRELALREIEWLAGQGVELVEQPLPAGKSPQQGLSDMAWLKERSPLPLMADESFHHAEDIPLLAQGFHGVNIKLMKCGGMLAALHAIAGARDHGLSVMLGCMVESGLGIAAAAQLAPLVDYVDLDGNLLLAGDIAESHPVEGGIIRLGDGPGLGVRPLGDPFEQGG